MKFVIASSARTGSHYLLYTLRDAGINVCPSEPFWITNRHKFKTNNYYDHVDYASVVLKQYDGFKIIFNHTMQLQEMCNANNAKLIVLKRNNLHAQLASYIIFALTNGTGDVNSYKGWTSTSKKMTYSKELVANIPFFDHRIDSILYSNYLTDNFFPKHENYLTTVVYEHMEDSKKILEDHFKVKLDLNNPPESNIGDYFTNPDEFISDIDHRIKMLSDCF